LPQRIDAKGSVFLKKEDIFYMKNKLTAAFLESALINFAVAHAMAFEPLLLYFYFIALMWLLSWKAKPYSQLGNSEDKFI
jgi:hypothetical protein